MDSPPREFPLRELPPHVNSTMKSATLKPSMTSHLSLPTFQRWPLAVPLLAIFLISSSASALLMRPNGPEPIIVQIKESLRLSDDLDNQLRQLAAAHNRNGLGAVKWHAGDKLHVGHRFR